MGHVKYTFKPSDFEAIACSPQVASIVLGIANKAKAIAEGLSADFVVTGDYEKSFEASVQVRQLPGDEGGHPHKAAVGVLLNTTDYALQVEYGVGGSAKRPTGPAHKVLKRTLGSLVLHD